MQRVRLAHNELIELAVQARSIIVPGLAAVHIDFTLASYHGQTPLSFAAAQQTLQLSYLDPQLYHETWWHGDLWA